MKKTFILSLIFVIFGLCAWAEDDTVSAESAGVVSTAVDDNSGIVDEDVTVTIDYGSNDFTAEVLLFEEIVTLPQHGTVGNESYPHIDYTPSADFYQYSSTSPIDSFQYSIKYNDSGLLDSAWVYIDSITGINDVPLALDDSYMVVQDSGVIYAPVLINDIDRDRGGLTVKMMSTVAVQHGTVKFHEDVYKLGADYLFFPNDETQYNTNLGKAFDERDMSYLSDTVFVYEPDSGFYGYDTMKYIISEYRPASIPPFSSESAKYQFVWSSDVDTATVIFYVEPHDYIPVAVNDTVLGASMKESDVRQSHSFSPIANDLDADTVPAMPSVMFAMPYIIADKGDSTTATADDDTLIFYHDIAEYDTLKGAIIYRKDSNMAVIKDDSLWYTYASGYSGVDSLFYRVIEKDFVASDYPNRFRGDTSDLAVIYFVVEPTNDVTHPLPDTLDYSYKKLEVINKKEKLQYFDVLANDLDVDDMDSLTLSTLKRLMGTAYKSEFETYGQPSVKIKGGLLETVVNANPGMVHLLKDSVFYEYATPYGTELLIDSFQYVIYNGAITDTSEWAFIRHRAVVANDDYKPVSLSELKLYEGDSTIASNLDLTSNDVSYDTIFILYNADSSLNSPSMSPYAQVLQPESGEADYYYHQGFTVIDSFQYIVSDRITNDTAWVFISNTPCDAVDDTVILQEDPFLSDSYVEEIDVLQNDDDAENLKYIIPFSSDTLDTGRGLAVVTGEGIGAMVSYHYKTSFFYKDSFSYVLTDVPSYFAADNFFTRDTAWIYIIDTAFLVDSDGDGIVNTMEDGIEGYQMQEDTLDSDGDGIPNYLDNTAAGFPSAGDCDNDGIENSLDDTPGCNDIEVSTAFTPNGDGVNDLFIIPEIVLGRSAVMPATIKIYNRWGSLVYENDSYGEGNSDWWDGNLGNVQGVKVGDELPNGVYLYYMTYGDGQFKKEGYVHIQR